MISGRQIDILSALAVYGYLTAPQILKLRTYSDKASLYAALANLDRLGLIAGTAPQAIDDALCAYKFVVDEARKTGRSNRFVVSGSSAGGHLALLVGILNNSGDDHPCKAAVAPSAIVSWYGITDIALTEKFSAEINPGDNFSLTWTGSKARVAEISARYSPLFLVTDRTPPIITIHGNADNVAPYSQAIALHAALRTRNRLITIEGGKHGGFSDPQTRDSLAAIFAFLGE